MRTTTRPYSFRRMCAVLVSTMAELQVCYRRPRERHTPRLSTGSSPPKGVPFAHVSVDRLGRHVCIGVSDTDTLAVPTGDVDADPSVLAESRLARRAGADGCRRAGTGCHRPPDVLHQS